MPDTDIIIIGAGLTGLTTATLLQNFLNEIGVEVFIQELGDKAIFEPISTSPSYLASLPKNDEPSLRIKGGSFAPIKMLANKVGMNNILLSEKALSIGQNDNFLEVTSDKATYRADKIISTIPPNLLINTIKFESELPNEIRSVAANTHTWMGESIKVALSYSKPFWKSENSSGTVLSNVGPVNEMYDHSNYEKNYYAIMGFLNGSFYAVSREERKQMVLQQLKKYYGSVVKEYDSYFEKVWIQEPDTFYSYNTHVLPHQNNGHQIYQQTFLNDRLIIAGSETSPIYPRRNL